MGIRMKVLLVENDELSADALGYALEHAGFDVTVMCSPLQAWDHLSRNNRIDLLVTRLSFGPGQIPGTAIGARAWSNGVPVIYIPATRELATHAVEEHGAVLVKPFAAFTLVTTAQRVVTDLAVMEHVARRHGFAGARPVDFHPKSRPAKTPTTLPTSAHTQATSAPNHRWQS
jgi:DNA-binding response OmpR family regulator